MSDSLQPHGLHIGVVSLSLLQGIFPTQGSNPGLPHCRQIVYKLSHKGSPRILKWVIYPFCSRSFQPCDWTGVSCIAGRFFTNWAMKEAQSFNHANAFDYVDHNRLWKILKEMEIPDHLTCLLRNLYEGQAATVRTGHRITDWFQIGKRVRQGCTLPSSLFNLYAYYIMQNVRLEEAQAGIKIAGRNINNSDMQMISPLWRKVKKN